MPQYIKMRKEKKKENGCFCIYTKLKCLIIVNKYCNWDLNASIFPSFI